MVGQAIATVYSNLHFLGAVTRPGRKKRSDPCLVTAKCKWQPAHLNAGSSTGPRRTFRLVVMCLGGGDDGSK